jgi:hypothetical protein
MKLGISSQDLQDLILISLDLKEEYEWWVKMQLRQVGIGSSRNLL